MESTGQNFTGQAVSSMGTIAAATLDGLPVVVLSYDYEGSNVMDGKTMTGTSRDGRQYLSIHDGAVWSAATKSGRSVPYNGVPDCGVVSMGEALSAVLPSDMEVRLSGSLNLVPWRTALGKGKTGARRLTCTALPAVVEDVVVPAGTFPGCKKVHSV
jgi:hypothetical protein